MARIKRGLAVPSGGGDDLFDHGHDTHSAPPVAAPKPVGVKYVRPPAWFYAALALFYFLSWLTQLSRSLDTLNAEVIKLRYRVIKRESEMARLQAEVIKLSSKGIKLESEMARLKRLNALEAPQRDTQSATQTTRAARTTARFARLQVGTVQGDQRHSNTTLA